METALVYFINTLGAVTVHVKHVLASLSNSITHQPIALESCSNP